MQSMLFTLPGGVLLIALGFVLLARLSGLGGKATALLLSGIVLLVYVPLASWRWPGADVFAIHLAVYLVTVYVLGIVATQLDARRAGDGRWFHWGPAAMVGFFVVVIAVNAVLLYLAQAGLGSDLARALLPEPRGGGEVSSHFPGTVTHDYQQKEDQYNTWRERLAAQQQRGWQVRKGWLDEPVAGAPALFQVSVSDRDGRPVAGAQVTGTFQRAADSRLDQKFAMQEHERGVYRTKLILGEPGQWQLLLRITRDGASHEIIGRTQVKVDTGD
ncbi:MAG: FixH family protein [Pseudomonadota bacterium]|nr:MAG: FixH family protein [Pseudomonadota bacterium]